MRALWAFVVVCLMAVGGVSPARGPAARDDLGGEQARDLRGVHPGLPAIGAPHGRAIELATRPRPSAPHLPPAILAAPPALGGIARVSVIASATRAHRDPSTAPAHRSARGPPV